MEIIIGLTIPFLGTAIGAAMVFMFRDRISGMLNRAMLGFASGVMVVSAEPLFTGMFTLKVGVTESELPSKLSVRLYSSDARKGIQ